jgi:subtilisin-like proprotein convertase family protein
MQSKITLKSLRLACKISVAFLFFFSFFMSTTSAQTTITTTYPSNNGNGFVTFNFKNNNSFPVIITGVGSIVNLLSGNADVSAWFKPGAIAGAPGAISTANGWTSFGTATITGNGAGTVQPFFTNSTLSVPAGSTYGICVNSFAAGGTTGALAYSGLGTATVGTLTTSAGGCDIITGDNIGYAGAGVPNAPANTPRLFIGTVTFISGVCTNTPASTPVIVASALSICSGSPVTLTASGSLNSSASWKWYSGSCGGTAVGTGNSIVVSPTVTTTYYARGEGGCGTTANGLCGVNTITVVPCACVIPGAAIICEGTAQKLTVAGAGTVGTGTATTGAISVTVPDANAAGITSTLPVTLPAGASLTSVAINFTMTHTWDSDMTINLISPNGTVINLLSGVGGSGDNFTNTTLTSVGTPPSIATGTAPFTGTWAPQGIAAVGPTGLQQTAGVNNFAAFITTANAGAVSGNWRLAMSDGAGGDVGLLTNWNLNFGYVILPTAIWTGAAGTIFSNAAANTPYVAGTQANAVWVTPAATSTYTATIASGPCAGANNVVVTVLPRPVITVSPTSGCSPLTITASGAVGYNWTPTTGLSSGSGATVIASPTATTAYSVTGLSASGCASLPVSSTVNSSPVTAVLSALAGATFQINEGFTTVLPTGWSFKNNSTPGGTTNWFQGAPATFPAFNGPTNSYAAANFQNTITSGPGDISTWLFTPVVNIKNGDVISFYTRTTDGTFPDRLEVRYSTLGTSVNVGATTTSTGDFTNLILTVNPTLLTGSAYPLTWTKYTLTISGLAAPTTGRVAFRYSVPNGGGGANSDYIGVDQVEYFTPASVNCANTVNNIKVDITGGVAPYTLVYSDGTANTTFNNYASGTNITVAPAVSTTYSIVSVTGANGCPVPSSGVSGSAAITVTPVAAITTQPVNKSICVGANTTFTVVPNTTNGTTYQWEVNPGTGVWANATGGVYSGGTTATLTITGATASMLGYSYRVKVTGFCGGTPISTPATLTVVTPAGGTATLTNATVCTNASTTLTLGGTLTGGPGFTYQYQVSTDGGTTFANVNNGGIYSGATTTTLTITNPPIVNPKYQYRVVVNTVNACGGFNSTVATLTVNPLPVVTISAAPIVKLFPGLTSTLTAAVSNGTSPYTYQWIRNGASVATATTNSLVVGIDALGTYTLLVSDVNGCVAAAGTSTPGSIAISDSVTTDRLFIYPSPNRGQFQVRYFTNLSDGSKVPGAINIYDEKGTRVFSSLYSVGGGYQPMRVDLGAIHGKGVYRVDVIDTRGERLKTGSVMVF